MTFSFTIDGLRLYSTNTRMHWAVRHKRNLLERQGVVWNWPIGVLPDGLKKFQEATVRITRLGPRRMDSDNLVISGKGTRDAIARRLGVDDGDPRVGYSYAQRKAKDYGVDVDIEVKP